jgi:predicted ATP-grasp superfamily ATP-dependent carboligase
MEVAREAGVPVPRQVVVTGPDDAAPLQDLSPGTPLVLKPARSAVLWDGGVRKFGVRPVAGTDEVADALGRFPPEAYPILVQERIVGPGLGAFLLADDGRPVASFAHRRIREKPPTGGVSVYRESVPLRPDVRRHAERILEAFRWTGVAMVEFKEEAATGTPYLMEVNGRFWGSLQLAIDAGVDFPALLVRMALGEEVGEAPAARLGIRSRWLWGDVDHLLWMLTRSGAARAGRPELPGRLGALGRFLIPWRPGDRFEVLRASDPLPFLRESAQWLRAMPDR